MLSSNDIKCIFACQHGSSVRVRLEVRGNANTSRRVLDRENPSPYPLPCWEREVAGASGDLLDSEESPHLAPQFKSRPFYPFAWFRFVFLGVATACPSGL